MAARPNADWQLGQHKKDLKENEAGRKEVWAKTKRSNRWAVEMIFRIDFTDFEFKSKGLNIFKPNLN
jgi:hypothetical protein